MEETVAPKWPKFVILLIVLGMAAGTAWHKGWVPPLVERALGRTPQVQVQAYLEAVRRGDSNAALARWPIRLTSTGRTDAKLEARRQQITSLLLAMGPELRYRVIDIQWLGNCCDPHPSDALNAGVARMRIEITGAQGQHAEYIFDVITPEPYWGDAGGYEVRQWLLRDVYPPDEPPLAFPHVFPTAASPAADGRTP